MAVIDRIFSITHFLNIIVIILAVASVILAVLDVYKAAIADKVEVANAQMKQLGQKMNLSLTHLYYATMSFLGLWFAFLIVSVAMKEHEAAGPGFICILFVLLFIWLMDLMDTKLRKLKLLQSSFEVPLTSTIMMRAALTAAEKKQQESLLGPSRQASTAAGTSVAGTSPDPAATELQPAANSRTNTFV